MTAKYCVNLIPTSQITVGQEKTFVSKHLYKNIMYSRRTGDKQEQTTDCQAYTTARKECGHICF